jgi:hypothetical protein
MDIKKEIEDLKARIQELENQIEPVKWQPVGGNWFIDDEGIVFHSPSTQGMKEFGHERPTNEQAERAAVEMRKFNRLLALRDELCGDDVVDWESTMSDKWRLFHDNRDGEWKVAKNQYMQDVAVYFTKEEQVRRVCDMLNSGEVEL